MYYVGVSSYTDALRQDLPPFNITTYYITPPTKCIHNGNGGMATYRDARGVL